jgi:hypothetical protein
MIIRIFLFLIFAATCTLSQGQAPTYKVNKIKTVRNYYVIYLTRNDSTYKVVSKREKINSCNKIKKNMSYTIEFSKVNFLGGSEVDCFQFDKKTIICKEIDTGLYVATNLKGLCLID